MAKTRIPIHGYLIRHGPGARVRVTVNDLPLHGGTTPDQDSISGVLNHLMVPGTNVLRAEVLHGNRKEPAAYFEVDARGSDTYPRCKVNWLEGLGTVADIGILDWAGEAIFEAEEGLPTPMWMAAPAQPVPDEGTEELWGEIHALVKAFETGSAEDVISAFALKVSDMHDMMETKWSSPALARELMTSTLDRPWSVEPIFPETTFFRSIQGDRLVHVGRLDAHEVLRAHRIGGEQQVKVAMDLVFMRHEGRWRIIR